MDDNLRKSRKNQTLRLLTTKEKLVIKATTGKRCLADAKETFAIIDPRLKSDYRLVDETSYEFEYYGVDKTSYATDEVFVDVYEEANGGFIDTSWAFSLLSDDLNKLCFTQEQIESFCLNNPKWLNTGSAILFLFKHRFIVREQEYEEFVVADVIKNSSGLDVCAYALKYSVDRNTYRRRLVVPQL